jgi:SOS response regulatory protein OraA/RecX
VPLDCAAEARLAVGVPLDRVRARELGRALRRRRALDVAARALRTTAHSRASLETRLAGRGVGVEDRASTLGVLERAGIVDDQRGAHSRAELLATRGHGNEAIRADLEQRGFPTDAVTTAVDALDAEIERAARIVAARGASPRTARLLARHGFDQDAIEAVIAIVSPDELG